MRRLLMLVSVVCLLSLCACSTPSLKAVENVAKSNEIIHREYLVYVKNDKNLDDDSKDDRVKMVESAQRTLEALKRAAGDD
jgi:hypothetical protein